MKDKSLIVYYSHSGNTSKIAEIIHKKVDGDISRIEPINPYPRDYNRVVDQAKKEIKSGYIPDLQLHIDDINSYNKIFIGSPNWWNTIAPPVKSFLLQYDLSGKVVIPFCTHGGGGQGCIFSDIAKKCNNSTIKKGFAIYGNGGSKAEKMIANWLGELG